jgi:hypothetical protein
MPHAQTKSGTSASPADLEALLERLAALNIEGVSGTSLEADGLIHLAVEHGHEGEVHDALAEYHPKWTTDLFVEEFDAQAVVQPGILLGIIQRAKQANPGRAIDTVLTGVRSDAPGIFYVQVTFVGSDWTNDPPP